MVHSIQALGQPSLSLWQRPLQPFEGATGAFAPPILIAADLSLHGGGGENIYFRKIQELTAEGGTPKWTP